MDTILNDFLTFYLTLIESMHSDGSVMPLALRLLPLMLLLEVPYTLFVALGVSRWRSLQDRPKYQKNRHYPKVSCVITCYSEGHDVLKTIRSLLHQRYEGVIEIIPVIDGSIQNQETDLAARESLVEAAQFFNRVVKIVSKPVRGGRVSSLNSGLSIATGEIVMALDGDTSFDNDMVFNASEHFSDQNVVALSGNLRVRNSEVSLTAKLQAFEYLLGITYGRLGLAHWGIINNISGAFGVFRTAFLRHIGGWGSGTAEDFDLTTRIKNYLGRHPHLKLVFDPYAVGHTDGPHTFSMLLKQRLRWDGDLVYMYLRKHWKSFSPRILGWPNFLLYTCLGLIVQLALPFLIVAYHIWVLMVYPVGMAIGILFFIYLAYLLMTIFAFIHYLIAVSRERAKDLRLATILPLFPLYTLFFRFAFIWFFFQEMLFKSHLDSSMAPWWVLKKESAK